MSDVLSDPRAQLHVAVEPLFCGCGQPWEALALIHRVLKLAPLYASQDELERLLPGPGVQMIVLYALTEADLLEHGGSIGGSWLTDTGKLALATLDAIAEEEGYERYTETGRCVHGVSFDQSCPECERLNGMQS